VVRATGDALAMHRERLDAGWINGAELARGVSTVVTTFSEAPRTVVIVLDDPAAFGDAVGSRQLLLGLDGAERKTDAAGEPVPPVLLAMENRSVLAYDIVPSGKAPVAVTIASEAGWSLVGVMGTSQLDATGAIAAVSARGLDAVLRPFAAAPAKDVVASRLAWLGPTRTQAQRSAARALSSGPLPEPPSRTDSAAATVATDQRDQDPSADDRGHEPWQALLDGAWKTFLRLGSWRADR